MIYETYLRNSHFFATIMQVWQTSAICMHTAHATCAVLYGDARFWSHFSISS